MLESPDVDNVTCILPMGSWEAVSQMSKAEILDAEAHTARLVHTRAWSDAWDKVLDAGRKAA